MIFDWDDGNKAKCQKHGVSIEEIEAFFIAGPKVAPSQSYAGPEVRFIAIGRNSTGRPMFVAFTLRMRRGHTCVRPISARYMHGKEVERYEASSKDDD
jgi:uncharacterized DUF497 family protein